MEVPDNPLPQPPIIQFFTNFHLFCFLSISHGHPYLPYHHLRASQVTVLLQLSLMLKATSSFSTYSSKKGLCPADFNSTIIFKIILLLSVQFLLPMPQSVPPRSLLTQFPASPFQSLNPAIISICEEVFSSPLVSY